MWVWSGVLLQDLDDVPPVRPIEMVPQPASGVGQPWAPWEGEVSIQVEDYTFTLTFQIVGEILRENTPLAFYLAYAFYDLQGQ